MDLEGLQSDLVALRRLYGLLVNEEQYVDDAGYGNLDKKARRLLISLLDDAANKVFESHAKMLGTQFRTSYSVWSIQQNPQTLSLGNTPTNFTGGVQNTAMVPSQVDVINSEGIFSDPSNQVIFSGQSNSISTGEYNVRLKRCRVCQKPKVKQLTKEISIRDSNGFNLNNLGENQSHKRRWEIGNDPNVVGDSAWSSNSQTVDVFKSLALTNLTDEEDKIAREASTKIQQIESCISDLQVASARVNPFETDLESQLSQTGIFAVGRNDPKSGTTSRTNWNSQPVYKMLPTSQETGIETFDQMKNKYDDRWDDETPRSYEELTLQSQPVYKMLPGSQTMSQETSIEMFDQMKNQYGPQWDNETPRSYEELTLKSQPFNTMLPSSQRKNQTTGNEMFDQNKSQCDHRWYDQTSRSVEELTLEGQPVNKMLPNSQKISQVTENEMLKQIKIQRDHQWHEETPRSNIELILQGQQVNTMPPSNQTARIEMFDYRKNHQDRMPEETYNFQSGGVSSNVNKTTYKNYRNLSSQINKEPLDQMQKTQWLIPSVGSMAHLRHNTEQQESEFLMRKKPGIPYKDKEQINNYKGIRLKQEPVEPNRLDLRESQWLSDSPVSSSTHSSNQSSQSESESENESQSENQNESESESQSESQSESPSESQSQQDSTSLSNSDHEESESEMYSVSSRDQSDKSSSYESSGSISSNRKDNQKEPKRKQVGQLKKLKDKLAVIFHHHHHHHHHHHNDENNHKKSIWKRAGKVIGHKTKQVEAYGEKAVHNIQKKAIPNIQAYGGKAVHNIQKTAIPNIQAYGEKAVHKIQKKAVPNIQAYGKKAVHNIQKKAVHNIQAYGEKAVHNIQKKAIPNIQAYGEKAVHNIQKKAVHNIQKKALVLQVGHKNQKQHLQKLVGGIIKQSPQLKKPKTSKSKALVTRDPSVKRSGKKMGKKMSWFQILRTQRKIKRIEKLRGKLNK